MAQQPAAECRQAVSCKLCIACRGRASSATHLISAPLWDMWLEFRSCCSVATPALPAADMVCHGQDVAVSHQICYSTSSKMLRLVTPSKVDRWNMSETGAPVFTRACVPLQKASIMLHNALLPIGLPPISSKSVVSSLTSSVIVAPLEHDLHRS